MRHHHTHIIFSSAARRAICIGVVALAMGLTPAAAASQGPDAGPDMAVVAKHSVIADSAKAAHGGGVDAAIERTPLGRPAAPVAAQKPASSAASSDWWSLVKTALSLAGVIGLILGIGAIAKRVYGSGGLCASLGAGGRAPSGVLSVLGRYPLHRGTTLVLLRMDRRVLLVSQCTARTGSAVSTLCEVTDAEEVASILAKCGAGGGDTQAGRFNASLAEADRAMSVAEPSAQSRRAAPVRAVPAGSSQSGSQVADSLRRRLADIRATPAATKGVLA